MSEKEVDPSCCPPGESGRSCCKVEAVVSVDERGQMVLPKDIRERANISPGDKLAVVSWMKDGEICCITLMKTKGFEGVVKDMLGPMF